MLRAGVRVEELERDLRAVVEGEVRFDDGTRATYSTDASNYRQVPIGVVLPRTPEDAVAAVRACHRHRAPLLSRGGGTSLAGECTNTAVVLDWSKYCAEIEQVDVEGRTAVVQPGVVLDVLNAHLGQHGLRFGPEPSTHPNCTLGGMLGNNSCGATAQAYGKTVDNIRRLEVLTHDGERFWVGPTDDDRYPDLTWDAVMAAGGRRAAIYRAPASARRHPRRPHPRGLPRHPAPGLGLQPRLTPAGERLPRRQGPGRQREHLRDHPARRARAGSCARRHHAGPARLSRHRRGSRGRAGDPPAPPVQARGAGPPPRRPRARQGHARPRAAGAAGWRRLVVRQHGRRRPGCGSRGVDALVEDLSRNGATAPPSHIVTDPHQEEVLWSVREGGLGATARPGGPAETRPDCWPGWEDSAVDPHRLGDYLRDLRDTFKRFGYEDVSVYGHFGQGCVHCRIPFDLVTEAGVQQFRSFLDAAADLVVSYGGSLSGEHGDGQARGPLLHKMFGPELVGAMQDFRAVWDPDGLMNPGKVVDSRPVTTDLRLGPTWSPADPSDVQFRYPEDDGSFQRAVLRCVGVGKCHSPQTDGRVMCPAYRATREEEHSTRGRSRLLFEMLDGHADSPSRTGGGPRPSATPSTCAWPARGA